MLTVNLRRKRPVLHLVSYIPKKVINQGTVFPSPDSKVPILKFDPIDLPEFYCDEPQRHFFVPNNTRE